MNGMDRRSFLGHAAGAMAAVSLMPGVLPAAPVRRGAPLGVGLIGGGRQGAVLLAELAKIDACAVVGVCDTDKSRLDRALRRTQNAQGFDTHKALLDSKTVQAVLIATPTHLHREIALDCIAAGKHVYCETPLAHTAEDCLAISRAAKDSKTVFAAALEGRSNPIYQLARTFYRTEAFRDLVTMRAQAYQKTTWRVPASDPARDKALNWRLDKDVSLGLVGEIGVNQLDVFAWYSGMLPLAVRGAGSIRLHDDGRQVPDTVQASFEYAGGVHATYEATLANSFQGRHEVLVGSNAAMKLAWSHGWMFKESDSPQMGFEVYANKQQFHNDEGITLIADATKLAAQGKLQDGVGLPNPPAYYALVDFIKSVTEGRAVAGSASDAARAAMVAIAANKAVTTGETVRLDADALRSA